MAAERNRINGLGEWRLADTPPALSPQLCAHNRGYDQRWWAAASPPHQRDLAPTGHPSRRLTTGRSRGSLRKEHCINDVDDAVRRLDIGGDDVDAVHVDLAAA